MLDPALHCMRAVLGISICEGEKPSQDNTSTLLSPRDSDRSLRLSGCWRLAGCPCPAALPPGSATLEQPGGATNHTSFVQWRPRAAGGDELQAEEASTHLRQRQQWQPQIAHLLRKFRLLQEVDLSGIPALRDEDLRCLWERAEASPGVDSNGAEAATERSVAACRCASHAPCCTVR